MKKLYVLIAFVFFCTHTSAQTCETLLKIGKTDYDTGEYAKAKKAFEKGKNNSECKNIDFQSWINKCDEKINEAKPQPQPKILPKPLDPKKIQCEQRWTDGIAAYDAGNYQEALKCFQNGVQENCTNFDFADYVERCKRKMDVTIPMTDIQDKFAEIQNIITLNINTSPTYSYENGKYKGQKDSNGNPIGFGAYYWDGGSFYFGSWKEGEKNGSGIYIVPDGYSISNCPNCTYYVGGFLNNHKSGTGSCYDKTGKLIYNGNFANGKPTEAYPTIGDSSPYKFEITEFGNGKYMGETTEGKVDGIGIYFWDEGGMWCGSWENGIRNGNGVFIKLNGSILAGTWLGDEYMP